MLPIAQEASDYEANPFEQSRQNVMRQPWVYVTV